MSGILKEQTEQLRVRIAKVFADSMENEEAARAVAFHMTDWDHNLEDMIKLYEQQKSLSDHEILQTVIQFLAHVPEHVAAAKKLAGLGPITDVFEVGVFEEDED